MGIYDRDYERGYSDSYGGGGWRPEGEGGLQLRPPQTAVGWVLLVTIGVFVVQLVTGERVAVPELQRTVTVSPFTDFFHLDPGWWSQPWRVFTLLTYGLLHEPTYWWHIAGNMFSFWLFGRELERRYGSREFLLFYITAIVFAGLTYTLFSLATGARNPVIGASGGTVAVTILFAFLYPHVRILFMMVIPMPMWVLGAIIVGQDLLRAVGGGGRVAFAAHLGGAAFALLYYKQRWRLSEWLPKSLPAPSFKRRPKLRVHSYDETAEADEQDPDEALAAEVDRILKKISDSGQDSLTRKERRTLEKASRQAQQRNR